MREGSIIHTDDELEEVKLRQETYKYLLYLSWVFALIFFLLIYFNLSIANGLDLSFGLEYPFKDLDENITCVWGGGSTDDGKWTQNETMPLAISFKPFNMKDRKDYFWHDELFFEQPEDLSAIHLQSFPEHCATLQVSSVFANESSH